MHHYCWGLMASNKATLFSVSRQERRFLLGESIQQFNYVLRNAPQNFVLLPEILTRKGENLIRLGQNPQGIAELRRAIDIKPDYWPPYAYLSDHYKKAGDIATAREWLEKGLSAAPDTKALQQRVAELDELKDKRKIVPQPAAEPPVPPLPKRRRQARDRSPTQPRQ